MYHNFVMNKENAFSRLARELIANFSGSRPIHANSLLITLYGDTICPFGGTVWLGSLINLVEPLGINDRLVRTSVYRLTEKNILQSRQIGRRSYYTLTERGLRQFESASRRIYAKAPPDWNGGWWLVMTSLGELDTEQREAVRKELLWLGFSRLLAGVHVHPTADIKAVKSMLKEHGVREEVVVLQATTVAESESIADQLLSRCFESEAMDEAWQDFITVFQPLLAAARKASQLNLELCFLVRTLLIHRYRHILLREPELPTALLPADASSQQARRITQELYLRLSPQADSHFLRVAESVDGAFQQPVEGYYRRFGV